MMINMLLVTTVEDIREAKWNEVMLKTIIDNLWKYEE